MSDVRTSNNFDHLMYDPALHGYTDGFFLKATTGTPAISGSVLRFTSATAYSVPQFLHGEYEFKLNVPALSGAVLTCGAAGTTTITDWDVITDGEFAITIDGTDYDVTGLDFSGGTYTPAYLTGGTSATSAIDTWAAVTSGGFSITINGTVRAVTGINFKTAFPYTSAYLTGGNSATSAIDTWAAVTDGSFAMTIDGSARTISGINFKTAFPYTSAYLTGGAGATTNVDTWAAVTDGSFAMTVDGTLRTVSGIDFSAVAAYTPAFLTGGALATSNPLTWEAVTDGEFNIVVNGVSRDVTGIDFSNVVAYTPAFLTGGGAATSNPAIWSAITDGEFKITINGVARTVTAIDFTGDTTMADVAATIQAALRAVTSLTETVVWDTDHFVITSSVTTSSSAITVAETVAAPAGTDISGAGGTDFMDCDTGHGTVTNKVSNLTMSDVATKIQTALRTVTSSTETVVWSTNHFVISSVLTTSSSAITVTAAVAAPAGTDISGAGVTAFLDSETGRGTVTNKASLMTMSQVATTIQTALRAATSALETVTWSTDHFIVSSVNTTVDSAITVASATGGGTDISGAGGTAFMDSDTGNGTVTNHTTTKTMTDVASSIQTAVRAATSSTETVVWSTNHFVVSSVNTTVDSAITVASATGAGTDISGAGGTAFMDSDTGNGTVTNHTTAKTMTDVASEIQTAIRALTSSTETVVWSTNKFIVSSVNTTSISAMTVTSAPGAGTDISGAGGTAFMDAETGRGTVTNRAMADQMDFVAQVIEDAVVALTGDADTVVWSTDHFVLTSDTISGVSSITVLSAVSGGAGTDISGAGYMNGLTGTGTVTTASNKQFGLKSASYGNQNAILFQVTGDKLICRGYDKDGNTEYDTVTWLAAWTATATKYRISWYKDRVKFFVSDIQVAELNTSFPETAALSVYISNGDADNLDLSFIAFKSVEKEDTTFQTSSVTLSTGDIEIGAVELKDAGTDTRANILAANTARTTATIVVATQNVDASGKVAPAGEAVGNAPFTKLTDGTDTALVTTAGELNVNDSAATLTGGSKTVATSGTGEALGASLVTKWVYVRAKSTNTNNLYVGDSSVDAATNKQLILAAGDAVILSVTNRATVYLDVDTNGEGADFLCGS